MTQVKSVKHELGILKAAIRLARVAQAPTAELQNIVRQAESNWIVYDASIKQTRTWANRFIRYREKVFGRKKD